MFRSTPLKSSVDEILFSVYACAGAGTRQKQDESAFFAKLCRTAAAAARRCQKNRRTFGKNAAAPAVEVCAPVWYIE